MILRKLLKRTCKVGVENTSTPDGRGNPPTKEPPKDNNGKKVKKGVEAILTSIQD